MNELPADLETIKLQLLDGIHRATRRHRHRRRILRFALISLGVVAALSVSALAAGDELGVINLGGGVQAVHVAGYPAYDVQTKQTVLAGADSYVYHITGGQARLLDCPNHPSDIYVTSKQELNPEELRAAVEAANGVQPKAALTRIRGLISLSNGCGDAGVEAIVGGSRPAPSELPAPVTMYGHGEVPTAADAKVHKHRHAP